MAELTTIARPYADAAFDYAQQHQLIEAWSRGLAYLSGVVQDETAQTLLANPEADNAVKLAFMRDVAKDVLDPHMDNFLALLLENDRLPLMPEISAHFDAKKRALEGKIEAVVTSAVALNDSQLSQVREGLKRRFGKTVSLENRVDAALIGGMLIQAGDMVIDGSVRGQLDQLGNSLRS